MQYFIISYLGYSNKLLQKTNKQRILSKFIYIFFKQFPEIADFK